MNENMVLDPIEPADWDALCAAGDLGVQQHVSPDAAVLAARAAVRRAATTERLRRRRTRRGVLAGVAATALVAASVVVGVTHLDDGGGNGTTPAAEAVVVLQRAAEVTLEAPALVPAPGQYLKVTRVEEQWMFHEDDADAASEGAAPRYAVGVDGKPLAEKTRQITTTWIPQDLDDSWVVRRGKEEVLERVSASTPRLTGRSRPSPSRRRGTTRATGRPTGTQLSRVNLTPCSMRSAQRPWHRGHRRTRARSSVLRSPTCCVTRWHRLRCGQGCSGPWQRCRA